MKKSFTLIELMVTIVLGLILINFIFSFQFNFMKELKYLEAKEKLSMESFKLMEILTKGFKVDSDYISGVISLDYNQTTSFTEYISNLGKNIEFQNDNNHTKIYDKNLSKSYTYKKVLTNKGANLLKVKDKDGNYNGIYGIEFNSTIIPEYVNMPMGNPAYINYQKLVYTK